MEAGLHMATRTVAIELNKTDIVVEQTVSDVLAVQEAS